MGAEFLATTDDSQAGQTGHYVDITMPGDVASVRRQLVSALERFGYLVLEEEPIVARHTKARYSSSSILDYVKSITVRLKPSGSTSTRAIFEYSYYDVYGGGGRTVLTRQAEAIAAVASTQTQSLACSTCGADATGAPRFCRRCGAPIANAPAELEVLRLADESYAGYLCVLQGTIGMVLAFITLLSIIAIKGTASLTPAMVFTLIFAVPGLILLMFGLRRLRRTFSLKQGEESSLGSAPRLPEMNQRPDGLTARYIAGSIGEGTTGLLEPEQAERSVAEVDRSNR